MIRLFAFVALLGSVLLSAPARASIPMPCTVKLSGAVSTELKCTISVQYDKGTDVTTVDVRADPNGDVKSIRPGRIVLAGPPRKGSFDLGAMKDGGAGVTSKESVEFGASKDQKSGSLVLDVASTAKKGIHDLITGKLTGQLVSVKGGAVSLEVSF